MRRFPWSLGVAIATVSFYARAQTPSAGVVKLDYREGAACGGESAFVAQVTARSPRVHFSTNGEAASRALAVRIEPRGARMAGRIELRDADGTVTERNVTGASCDDVISAVGLVAALALDPLASTSPSTTTTTTTSTSPSANTENTSTNKEKIESEDDNAQTLAPERRRWSVGAGADGEVVFGVTPDPLFAVPVFFEVTRALGEHATIGSGLRFERAGETSLDATGAGADFTWTAGAVDLCLGWRVSRVRLHVCARSHFGAIDAHGEGATPNRSATRPWVDVSAALALRVRIAGPIFVELNGSAGIALVQDRFFLEPNQTVFQAPPLTGHVGGGLGFEIW